MHDALLEPRGSGDAPHSCDVDFDPDEPIPYSLSEPPPADGSDPRLTAFGLAIVVLVFAALVLGAFRGWL